MARLVVLSEGFTGRSYELKVEKTTVGRVEDNAFQIAEPSVSSHHCEILLRGNDVFVNDLNSTNGTFVNGEQVSGEAGIKPGQILRLGQVELRLETGAAGPSKKPLDHTMVIPQGVKLNELEGGTKPVTFQKDSPFAKKDKGVNKVFIVIAIVLGIAIIASIVVAVVKLNQPPGG